MRRRLTRGKLQAIQVALNIVITKHIIVGDDVKKDLLPALEWANEMLIKKSDKSE